MRSPEKHAFEVIDAETIAFTLVGVTVLVDRDIWEKIEGKYSIARAGYGYVTIRKQRGKIRTQVCLHKYVLGVESGIDVDHINRDKNDNRRCNLRIATRSQNMGNQKRNIRNKSGFKGVTFCKKCTVNPFMAKIKKDGKVTYLGSFPTPEEAHVAYMKAADRIFGEFACYG